MSEKKNNLEFVTQLLTEPEEAIESLQLVYVNRDDLPISRVGKRDDFRFLWNQKPVDDRKLLKRIENLVIPPAWEKVRITHLPNGHLQAIGRDAKNRKQYRYHRKWTEIRNRTKFYKMLSFGSQLPKIRKRVDQDLMQEGWPKSKVAALVIRLMEETHIRIGNEQYAKRNKTYGLTTLRTRHVHTFKDNIRFEFVGKRGKQHNITLRNRKLIRLVNQMEEIPGWELFQFYDRHNKKQAIDSTVINAYLHNISGSLFSAKDFRTWAATLIFFEHLKGFPNCTSPQQKHKNILAAYDVTAKALGNTRNVCRRSYVHPIIPRSYEDGSILPYFHRAENPEEETEYFSNSEMAIMQLIVHFQPLRTME